MAEAGKSERGTVRTIFRAVAILSSKAFRRIRRLAFILTAIVVLSVSLHQFGAIPKWIFQPLALGLSVIFFIIAIPLSIFIRLDLLPAHYGLTANGSALVLCLAVCVANLFLLSFLGALLGRGGEAKPKAAAPAPPPKAAADPPTTSKTGRSIH